MRRTNVQPNRGRRWAWGIAAPVLAALAASCSTTVTTSGNGGMGGGCTTPADCPPPVNACVVATCTSGVCGTQDLPVGAMLMVNPAKDCHDTQCDGNGNVILVIDVNNVPIPTSPCLVGTCDVTGTPGTSPKPAGTACMSAMVCDGNGQCVACLQSNDCPSGQSCTPTHACVTVSCTDGLQDGQETDVDCGGGGATPCDRCATGKKCKTGSDCIDLVCAQNMCQAAVCADTVKNGNETDADCGGSNTCPRCGPNKSCVVGSDCAGGQCGGGICTPNCMDGVKNGTETDVDCGGATCSKCAVAKTCKLDSDCASNACDALTLTCVASQCSDHHTNGTETDVDCGGGTCPGCPVGKKCNSNADCQAGHTCSTGTPHVCQ